MLFKLNTKFLVFFGLIIIVSFSTTLLTKSEVNTLLIANDSFEVNTSGWVSTYGSMVRIGDPVYSGSWSLRIDSVYDGNFMHEGGVSTTAISGVGATAYHDYYIALNSDGSASMSVYINWYSGASPISSTTIVSGYSTDDWQVFSGSVMSPPSTDNAKIEIYVYDMTSSFSVNIDTIQMQYPSAVPELTAVLIVPLIASSMMMIIIIKRRSEDL